MSTRPLRDLAAAHSVEFWARLAVHAFLKFMLPPGMSPEFAIGWSRQLVAVVGGLLPVRASSTAMA